ncbi:MAG: bifunctional (p)ppGpp synthetase/guanosine-3',5'-bis(diphosphate) 3'-pyrophosphohydrolase [Chromatiales bacterium]|nr:bifunctional (p)ppGpp synthetase/guanosine-3',5'-bis(diphosphate) 3'-pyrophosphohydrolase [Chromatiales bacterium]
MVTTSASTPGGSGLGSGSLVEAVLAAEPPSAVPALSRALDTARETSSECAVDAAQCVRILGDLGLDAESKVAACLSRALAGQPGAPPEIEAGFGATVARLVDGALRMEAMHDYLAPGSDDASGLHTERLRALLVTMVEDVRVVLIKLVEKLVLARRMRELPADARERAARETLEIYAPLASRLGIRQMKWELEDLAFRARDEAAYKSIARQLEERRADRERYIEATIAELGAALERAHIRATVTGRPKHLYSIYRKMRAKNLSLDQLFDLRAVRVMVDDVATCYSALGVVHGLWRHIPREFDDYVTKPKANGYQSLHTAVIGPEGKTLEIQIRTHSMHQHAELGVAAHWRYKEGGRGTDRGVDAKIAWLRQVVDLRDDAESSRDIIDRLGAELLTDRVYAVTPRGQILELPAGATALDFAYHVHTSVGHRCRGARVNGAIVPLTRELRSGDQVEVLTAREEAPSRDWLSPHLGYLRSARARAKVRQWFRQLDHDKNVAAGQELLARELRRLGVADADREALARRFNYTRLEEFLAGLGRGDVSPGQLAGALQQSLPPPQAPPLRAPGTRRDDGVEIHGVGSLLTQMARCCRPVPPDPVIGYVTRGRGVTIHRADCRNMLRLPESDRARLIEVSWAGTSRETYPVEVVVDAFDRGGLLRDVTAVVANEKIDITGLQSRSDARHQTASIRMTLEVEDLRQLQRVLDRIGQVPNVYEARRAT